MGDICYYSGATVRPDSKIKQSVRLLEVATGQQRPWLEHPSDTVTSIGFIGEDNNWLVIGLGAFGQQRTRARYIVPWRDTPIPVSEWIEFHVPAGNVNFNYAAAGNYFTFFLNGKLMAMRFDPKRGSVGEPYELKPPAGSAAFPTSYEATWIRGPGLVFARPEQISSVWLMKLPQN
jgi:hypothetical protein